MKKNKHRYNTPYSGDQLNQIAFPIGGMGAGMFTLQGTGYLGNFSLRNDPDIKNEPNIFAAVHVKSNKITRVLEGQITPNKIFNATGGYSDSHGNGLYWKNYGLPRFKDCSFSAAFPFASVSLKDQAVPLEVTIEGFSPFIPGESFSASLPFGSVQYTFTNRSNENLDSVFYFNAFRHLFMNNAKINCFENGFGFSQQGSEEKPWEQLDFNVFTDEPANIDAAWYRGNGDFITLSMLWDMMDAGVSETRAHEPEAQGKGATLSIPFSLKSGESKTIRLFISWFAPRTNLRVGHEFEDNLLDEEGKKTVEKYAPWYSGQFTAIEELNECIRNHYDYLYKESKAFSDCLFGSDLPPEALEAVAANLSILKSPTVLRQTDGRIWGWEGCFDNGGSCHGTCTHVWNYAQALCHLFPDLERGLRQTEFYDSQNQEGHQGFRASLPIGDIAHDFHAASDGQLGGVMKVYREWKISGDTDWLRGIWDKVKQSLEWCIKTWDPSQQGVLKECHHNTYDIEFWGAEIMCTSFYLGALVAAAQMAEALGDDAGAHYLSLYEKGKIYCETKLYNGEYFIQESKFDDLAEQPKPENDFPEVVKVFEAEGPRYQYGNGCVSDGVIGAWMGHLFGLEEILDKEKVISHLKSIYKYNFRESLLDHANPQRPGYALGDEAGLLLCSWPKGDKTAAPFPYSKEVWTGIEYEVASYLILMGMKKEGLDIVRACRDRYDGTVRNPFNEYECGHWYARAMSSYALLQAFSGARYDAVTKTLHLKPQIKGDFQCFFAAETGYGTVGVKSGEPFVDMKRGTLEVAQINYEKGE